MAVAHARGTRITPEMHEACTGSRRTVVASLEWYAACPPVRAAILRLRIRAAFGLATLAPIFARCMDSRTTTLVPVLEALSPEYRVLASRSMATVLLAELPALECAVAITVRHQQLVQEPSARALFRCEAEAAASRSHAPSSASIVLTSKYSAHKGVVARSACASSLYVLPLLGSNQDSSDPECGRLEKCMTGNHMFPSQRTKWPAVLSRPPPSIVRKRRRTAVAAVASSARSVSACGADPPACAPRRPAKCAAPRRRPRRRGCAGVASARSNPRRSPAHHRFSFARSSSKKFCTTTSVGVPAMSNQLLSCTMRNR